jgi:hypothetical protein
MSNAVSRILRRSVLMLLIVSLAGCGGGEPVVVQSKSDKLDRVKGVNKTPDAPGDPKAK